MIELHKLTKCAPKFAGYLPVLILYSLQKARTIENDVHSLCKFQIDKGRRQNSKQLAAAKMLQHPKAKYSISYISWLQQAAEYGGCSQLILTSPLSKGPSLQKSL